MVTTVGRELPDASCLIGLQGWWGERFPPPPPRTGKWSAMRQVMEGSKLLWKRNRLQQREETPTLWTLKEQSCKVPSPLGCNQTISGGQLCRAKQDLPSWRKWLGRTEQVFNPLYGIWLTKIEPCESNSCDSLNSPPCDARTEARK